LYELEYEREVYRYREFHCLRLRLLQKSEKEVIELKKSLSDFVGGKVFRKKNETAGRGKEVQRVDLEKEVPSQLDRDCSKVLIRLDDRVHCREPSVSLVGLRSEFLVDPPRVLQLKSEDC
jgi:hypothetical protein